MFSGLLVSCVVCSALGATPVPHQVESKVATFVPTTAELSVELARSRLLHFVRGVKRLAVADSAVCEVVQVSQTELMVIGRSEGVTDMTVWMPAESASGSDPLVIRVRVKGKQQPE